MNIPNLFGAYIKGGEYAIDRNWNDRHQYEDVLGKQIRNNQQELNLLADRADFGNMRAQNQFTTDEMARQNEISDIQQQGDVADAWLKANQAVDNWAVYKNLQSLMRENLLDTTRTNLENAKYANKVQDVVRNTYPPEEQGINIANIQQETANAQLSELTNPPDAPKSLFEDGVESVIYEADNRTANQINSLEAQISELRTLQAGGKLTEQQQVQLASLEAQLDRVREFYATNPLWTRTFINEKTKPIKDRLLELSIKYNASKSSNEKQQILNEFRALKQQFQIAVEELRQTPFNTPTPQTQQAQQAPQAQQAQQPTQNQQAQQAQQESLLSKVANSARRRGEIYNALTPNGKSWYITQTKGNK